ncbi:hypothetical protein [uncultured Alistipes sp.]|jgi:hypothetical protein|uniref:hypothetical protein n=1 Tax=uncultured Alistipes sp. TaxID=538949 RepID=UPI0025CD11C2|nr:hypothetical protein [uncultured Alistipes sp.]
MKKAGLLLCGLLLCTAFTVRSQDAPSAPQKPVVLVDFFFRNDTVPAPLTDTLRGNVIDAFARMGRFTPVDVTTVGQLAADPRPNDLTTPKTAIADLKAYLEARAETATQTGAHYLVSGAIRDFRIDSAKIAFLPSGPARSLPGKVEARFDVYLTACDLQAKHQITTEFFTLIGVHSTDEQACIDALATIGKQMEESADWVFGLHAAIVALGNPGKKGRIDEIIIQGGPESGIKAGDRFNVYEERSIADHKSRKELGYVHVVDAQDPGHIRCKIIRGNDQIKASFLADRDPVCIKRRKMVIY